MLGDCAFFFIQKAARGDIHSWSKVDGWAGALFADFLGQLMFKVIVDYTGLMQFRGAGVLGGCYWTTNMLLALAAPFGAVAIYYSNDVSSSCSLNESTAWVLVSSLCGAWILVFLTLLLLMNPAHRSSFYSTETIKAWVCKHFTREGAADHNKLMICVYYRRRLWVDIEPEVKAWTHANWGRLEREQPDWFTPGRIGRIDDEFIPPDSVERRRRAGGGSRRRSSLSARLLASVSVRDVESKPSNSGTNKVAPAP
jgi:hypothetical protein